MFGKIFPDELTNHLRGRQILLGTGRVSKALFLSGSISRVKRAVFDSMESSYHMMHIECK